MDVGWYSISSPRWNLFPFYSSFPYFLLTMTFLTPRDISSQVVDYSQPIIPSQSCATSSRPLVHQIIVPSQLRFAHPVCVPTVKSQRNRHFPNCTNPWRSLLSRKPRVTFKNHTEVQPPIQQPIIAPATQTYHVLKQTSLDQTRGRDTRLMNDVLLGKFRVNGCFKRPCLESWPDPFFYRRPFDAQTTTNKEWK